MNANRIAVRGISFINSIIDFIVLLIILLLLIFAGYALWDSNQIHRVADSAQYAVFKPTVENQGMPFKKLQAINQEAFAWLTVYGTNIDYPVMQGNDNMKYVNTNAEGQYSLAGAIFLDYRNSKYFTDFNSIIFGHNMANRTMFGELSRFSNKDVFDSLRYGSLYVDAEEYGIEFFAFVHADAYDNAIFTPDIKGEDRQQAYLDNLLASALHKRDIGVTIHDRIVLLATCSSGVSTNGRNILIGRLTDTHVTYVADTENISNDEAPVNVEEENGIITSIELPLCMLLLLIMLIILLILIILFILHLCKLRRYYEDRLRNSTTADS